MATELKKVMVRGVEFLIEASDLKMLMEAGELYARRENGKPMLYVGRQGRKVLRATTLMMPVMEKVFFRDGDSRNLRRENLIGRSEWNVVNLSGKVKLGRLMQRVATLNRELGRFGKKLEVKDGV